MTVDRSVDSPADATAWVEEIRRTGPYDDERGHREEDQLREAVLQAIADGRIEGEGAREVARIALTTDEIDFSRWCA